MSRFDNRAQRAVQVDVGGDQLAHPIQHQDTFGRELAALGREQREIRHEPTIGR